MVISSRNRVGKHLREEGIMTMSTGTTSPASFKSFKGAFQLDGPYRPTFEIYRFHLYDNGQVEAESILLFTRTPSRCHRLEGYFNPETGYIRLEMKDTFAGAFSDVVLVWDDIEEKLKPLVVQIIVPQRFEGFLTQTADGVWMGDVSRTNMDEAPEPYRISDRATVNIQLNLIRKEN